MQKDKYDAQPIDGPKREKRHDLADRLQYVLRAEEQILQAIAVRAPLAGILNAICAALDGQIGNIVSLISLDSDGPVSIGETAANAGLFGLHIFFVADLVSENGRELGLLEMFCCIQRKPSLDELQIIERAACLAGIAIKCYNENGRKGYFASSRDLSPMGFELEWPACVN